MNRYILTIIGILSSIFFMTNKANACTYSSPEVVLTNPTWQYIGVWDYSNPYSNADWGKTAYFDGSGSYDPDNGEQHLPGQGITSWQWDIYGFNESNLDYDIHLDGPYYSPYFYAYFDTIGRYQVRLTVTDDDDSTSSASSYFCVFDATITSTSSYSAYGSSKDFTYDLMPNEIWWPNRVWFSIVNQNNWWQVYFDDSDTQGTSLTTNRGENINYTWNGKNSSDSWLAPGSYLATLGAEVANPIYSEYWASGYGEEYYGWYSTYYASPALFAFTQVVDVTLTKCSSSFIPMGGIEDNNTPFTATLAGGSTGTIKFTLYDVSDEPGYCLNKPSSIPGSGEYSDSWKDLRFLSQNGFTISGSDDNVATTTSAVNSKTVIVTSNDYGAYGKIKAQAQINGVWYDAHIVNETTTFAKIPRDDNNNNIADNWTYDNGNANDDADTSANNSHNGDGLTRYKEYRGVDIDNDGKISSSERLNPNIKDLFIQDVNFGSGFPDFAIGTAFADANIAVHNFVGSIVTFPRDDENIDVLKVTATDAPYLVDQNPAWQDGGHIYRYGNPIGDYYRNWRNDIPGSSIAGTADYYGYPKIYKTSINYYFSDKPYKDNNAWTSDGIWGDPCNTILDLLSKVEDTNDNGLLDNNEKDGNTTAPYDDGDNYFDGDYPVDTNIPHPKWEFNHDFSPVDVNNNGLVEIKPYPGEYSKEQVVKNTTTHEMGHAVGIQGPQYNYYNCTNPGCIMSGTITWDPNLPFCNDCKSMILIHNKEGW